MRLRTRPPLLTYLLTLLSEANTFVEFLVTIKETSPVLETDMHIRQQLLDLSKFKEFPKLDEINQMEAIIRNEWQGLRVVTLSTTNRFCCAAKSQQRHGQSARTRLHARPSPTATLISEDCSKRYLWRESLIKPPTATRIATMLSTTLRPKYSLAKAKENAKAVAKEREKVEDEAAAKAKVEEAGNGRKNTHHLLSKSPSTANTAEEEYTQLRTAGRSRRITRNNKKMQCTTARTTCQP